MSFTSPPSHTEITENTIPAELHPSFMAKKPVKFTVVSVASPSFSIYRCGYILYIWIWLRIVRQVDAFTNSAFKGNPAAVCLLEEERDEDWLQALAMEFNISETCYLNRITEPEALDSSTTILTPRFRLRWFTPVAEVSSFLQFLSYAMFGCWEKVGISPLKEKALIR